MSEIVLGGGVGAGAGGILSIEARHQWNGGLMLNDLTGSPRFKLDTIGGLQSLAEAEDLRDLPTGRGGEIPRQSVRRGKTLAYNGRVQARSLSDLRAAISALSAAFEEVSGEGQMIVTPHPEYAEGFTRYYWARALSCDPGDEDLSPHRYWSFEQPFVIGLRMSDARFYDPVAVEADTGVISTSEGIVLPIIAPFVIPASGAAAGTVTVTNPGNAAVDPVIDIYGPVIDPALVHLGRGVNLSLTGISLDVDSFIRIDFGSRRIFLQGTTDYRSALDLLGSSWWDPGVPGLLPGENSIQLQGSGLADPAHAHIAFNPAFVA